MKEVYFVRHAESEANSNTNSRSSNVVDIPITENGREQARKLAEEISFASDLVVVSPYIRTLQTALPYITLHAIKNIETWDVQEFTYLNQSKYNNTTTAERRNVVDEYWQKIDIYYKDSDDSESFNEFVNRLLRVREKIINREEKKLLFFHMGT